jgi:hypothetical protein
MCLIVRLYTPKPAHVDLLPKIIEVRRKDTAGIARRIKRRHVGILHQNLADAGIVCNKSQRDKNPSYLDFHEHVILEGYAYLKLEPLADLANCFMPYVPGIRRTVRPRNVSAQNDVSFVFLIVLS